MHFSTSPVPALVVAALALLAASADAAGGHGRKKCHKPAPAAPKAVREIPLAIPKDQYVVAPLHPGDDAFKLKTGPNGEYMGASRGAKQVDPIRMHTVPVPRKSYEPRMQIKAAYVAPVAPHQSLIQKPGVAIADCQFQATKPMLNLDNFEQIKSIRCAGNTVTITFDGDASAATAQAEWTAHAASTNLAVMIGAEWKCGGKDTTAFRHVQTVATTHNTLVLKTDEATSDELVQDYAIEVNQYDDVAGEQELRKRGLFNWSKGKVWPWSLYVNYDKATEQPAKRDIALLTTPWAGAHCIDCYVKGEAALKIRVTGSVIVVKTYEIELSGELKANLDLLLSIYQTARTDLYRVPLWTLPLNPVAVPGVFSLGPELRLIAAISYGSDEQLDVATGFDLHLPLKWTMASDNGLFGKPKFTSSFEPAFNYHPVTASQDFSVRVAAHLIPEFGVTIAVLSMTAFSLDFGVDNALGVQVSRGKYAELQCPDGAGIGLLLYRQHDVDFAVRSPILNKKYTLWSSGRRALPCPNNACNRCIGGSKKNATAALLPAAVTETTSTTALSSAPASSATATTATTTSGVSTATTSTVATALIFKPDSLATTVTPVLSHATNTFTSFTTTVTIATPTPVISATTLTSATIQTPTRISTNPHVKVVLPVHETI
ncbi:hypothetical protein GGF32_007533 [Allomyces javanicus]|nr:hypothetical protein GGF32_007533 [Allomyces javanicus]